MTVAGRNASCIGTQEVEGVFEWQIQIQDLCAGITWAPGLTSPDTPVFGSNTTPNPGPLSFYSLVHKLVSKNNKSLLHNEIINQSSPY